MSDDSAKTVSAAGSVTPAAAATVVQSNSNVPSNIANTTSTGAPASPIAPTANRLRFTPRKPASSDGSALASSPVAPSSSLTSSPAASPHPSTSPSANDASLSSPPAHRATSSMTNLPTTPSNSLLAPSSPFAHLRSQSNPESSQQSQLQSPPSNEEKSNVASPSPKQSPLGGLRIHPAGAKLFPTSPGPVSSPDSNTRTIVAAENQAAAPGTTPTEINSTAAEGTGSQLNINTSSSPSPPPPAETTPTASPSKPSGSPQSSRAASAAASLSAAAARVSRLTAATAASAARANEVSQARAQRAGSPSPPARSRSVHHTPKSPTAASSAAGAAAAPKTPTKSGTATTGIASPEMKTPPTVGTAGAKKSPSTSAKTPSPPKVSPAKTKVGAELDSSTSSTDDSVEYEEVEVEIEVDEEGNEIVRETPSHNDADDDDEDEEEENSVPNRRPVDVMDPLVEDLDLEPEESQSELERRRKRAEARKEADRLQALASANPSIISVPADIPPASTQTTIASTPSLANPSHPNSATIVSRIANKISLSRIPLKSKVATGDSTTVASSAATSISVAPAISSTSVAAPDTTNDSTPVTVSAPITSSSSSPAAVPIASEVETSSSPALKSAVEISLASSSMYAALSATGSSATSTSTTAKKSAIPILGATKSTPTAESTAQAPESVAPAAARAVEPSTNVSTEATKRTESVVPSVHRPTTPATALSAIRATPVADVTTENDAPATVQSSRPASIHTVPVTSTLTVETVVAASPAPQSSPFPSTSTTPPLLSHDSAVAVVDAPMHSPLPADGSIASPAPVSSPTSSSGLLNRSLASGGNRIRLAPFSRPPKSPSHHTQANGLNASPSPPPNNSPPVTEPSVAAPVTPKSVASIPLLWTVTAPFDPTFMTQYKEDIHDLYFAYGSNLNLSRMRARKISTIGDKGISARLNEFQLCFNKYSEALGEEGTKRGAIGYANCIQSPSASVYGALYILPKPNTSTSGTAHHHAEGLEGLDVYEGVAQGMYARHQVPLMLQDGTRVTATTYLGCDNACAPRPDVLNPTQSYLNHLLAGLDILPEAYGNSLKKWKLSWMNDPALSVSSEKALEVSEPMTMGRYDTTSTSVIATAVTNGHIATVPQPQPRLMDPNFTPNIVSKPATPVRKKDSLMRAVTMGRLAREADDEGTDYPLDDEGDDDGDEPSEKWGSLTSAMFLPPDASPDGSPPQGSPTRGTVESQTSRLRRGYQGGGRSSRSTRPGGRRSSPSRAFHDRNPDLRATYTLEEEDLHRWHSSDEDIPSIIHPSYHGGEDEAPRSNSPSRMMEGHQAELSKYANESQNLRPKQTSAAPSPSESPPRRLEKTEKVVEQPSAVSAAVVPPTVVVATPVVDPDDPMLLLLNRHPNLMQSEELLAIQLEKASQVTAAAASAATTQPSTNAPVAQPDVPSILPSHYIYDYEDADQHTPTNMATNDSTVASSAFTDASSSLSEPLTAPSLELPYSLMDTTAPPESVIEEDEEVEQEGLEDEAAKSAQRLRELKRTQQQKTPVSAKLIPTAEDMILDEQAWATQSVQPNPNEKFTLPMPMREESLESLTADVNKHNEDLTSTLLSSPPILSDLATVLSTRPSLLQRVMKMSNKRGESDRELRGGACACDAAPPCSCVFPHPMSLHGSKLFLQIIDESLVDPSVILNVLIGVEQEQWGKDCANVVQKCLPRAMSRGFLDTVRLLVSQPAWLQAHLAPTVAEEEQQQAAREHRRRSVLHECVDADDESVGARCFSMVWETFFDESQQPRSIGALSTASSAAPHEAPATKTQRLESLLHEASSKSRISILSFLLNRLDTLKMPNADRNEVLSKAILDPSLESPFLVVQIVKARFKL